MKLTYLLMWPHAMGGTERSVILQAGGMARRGHDVTILGVLRDADRPFFQADPRVRWDYLLDVTDGMVSADPGLGDLGDTAGLHQTLSRLVPPPWESGFSLLTDAAFSRKLPKLDTDVLVSTTPALMSIAVDHAPQRTVLVHQEHRASEHRGTSKQPLISHGPRVDAMVLLTDATRNALAHELGHRAPRLEVIANPLDSGFRPTVTHRRPIIAAAGRLTKEKRFDDLVTAFSAIADEAPGWTLRIFGDGPERSRLRALIARHGLHDRVELPGHVADMATEWARSGIMALTSKFEGLSLVIQEAQAAGLPVVSYDCPNGPRHLIDDGVDGLLVPNADTAALAAALRRVIGDPALGDRLGSTARQHSTRWSVERIAERWERLFAELHDLERKHGRPARFRFVPLPVQEQELPSSDAIANLEQVAPVSQAAREEHRSPEDERVQVGSVVARLNTRHLPSDAIRANLEIVNRVAIAAGVDHLTLPPVRGTRPIVAVPSDQRQCFVQALVRAESRSTLRVHASGPTHTTLVSGSLDEVGTALLDCGATFLRVAETWADAGGRLVYGMPYSCEVQFWPADLGGNLIPPARNDLISELPPPPWRDARPGTVCDTTVTSLPLLLERNFDTMDFPIDVVCTWVDGSDPGWARGRESRRREVATEASHPEADSAARYRSRDELRYALRALDYYAPWVNKVWLVTAGQRPVWIRESSRLAVVDHREIFPESALPTFNSHAIESRLHHIDGLTENFIYLNDDVVLGRSLHPSQFFHPNGQAAVFLSPTKVGFDARPGETVEPHRQAALNNRSLMRGLHGRTLLNGMLHAPHPMLRSVLTELETLFPKEFHQTTHAPFRSDTDLSVASSLFQYHALATGRGYRAGLDVAYLSLARHDLGSVLNGVLASRKHEVLTLADYHEYALPAADVDVMVQAFLSGYLPLPSSFEQPPDDSGPWLEPVFSRRPDRVRNENAAESRH